MSKKKRCPQCDFQQNEIKCARKRIADLIVEMESIKKAKVLVELKLDKALKKVEELKGSYRGVILVSLYIHA